MSDIRYYLDEHVAAAVAKGLRRRGIDVLTVTDTRTMGDNDLDQFSLARKLGRVFVTHDADYARLAVFGFGHTGLVFATRQKPVGDVIRALVLIHQVLTAEELDGKIEFI